ncbi:spondin-1-like isoform X1 [Amphiura filiformis]|uniref:spondin-1-like isoform X1 n=1 Tax=Amphiura filiformis TaxID=82378 RepID=UPI003B2153DD
MILVLMVVILRGTSFTFGQDDTNSDSNDESLDCCACGSPKYKITFEGMWSSRTHRNFPEGYDHWSDLIGASHTRDYTIWEYGGMSSLGVKQAAELGSPIALEREIRAQGSYIKTVITAPGLWPAIGNMTALFRTNRTHNLVSVLTMLGPSPDWWVGISKANLCTEDCGWEEMKVFDLQPWDAGTDSGPTYRAANAPTRPQVPIHAITSSFPANEESPFYSSSGVPIKPLARIYLERIEFGDTSCDEPVNTGVGK